MRAEVKKGLSDVVENMKSVSNTELYSDADLKMPENPEALLKELYKYVAGGRSYCHVKNMGKGLVMISDAKARDPWQ